MRIYFQRKCMRILREFYKNYKGIIKEFYKNSIEFYWNSAGILSEFTEIQWKCCKKNEG